MKVKRLFSHLVLMNLLLLAGFADAQVRYTLVAAKGRSGLIHTPLDRQLKVGEQFLVGRNVDGFELKVARVKIILVQPKYCGIKIVKPIDDTILQKGDYLIVDSGSKGGVPAAPSDNRGDIEVVAGAALAADDEFRGFGEETTASSPQAQTAGENTQEPDWLQQLPEESPDPQAGATQSREAMPASQSTANATSAPASDWQTAQNSQAPLPESSSYTGVESQTPAKVKGASSRREVDLGTDVKLINRSRPLFGILATGFMPISDMTEVYGNMPAFGFQLIARVKGWTSIRVGVQFASLRPSDKVFGSLGKNDEFSGSLSIVSATFQPHVTESFYVDMGAGFYRQLEEWKIDGRMFNVAANAIGMIGGLGYQFNLGESMSIHVVGLGNLYFPKGGNRAFISVGASWMIML